MGEGSGGEAVGGEARSFSDLLQHTGAVVEHAPVGEAQDFETAGAEILVAVAVVSDLSRLRVDVAVDFDHEPPLIAAEVDDVGLDRELSPELQTPKPAAPQHLPDSLFRRGLFLAQLLRPARNS
jgi:hypothetical protein